MKILYILILCLLGTPAISADTPTPVTCVVTEVSKEYVTITCPKPNKRLTKRYIPVEQWPEQWAGRRMKGHKFPAQWKSGHLEPVMDDERRIQEMTREGHDYERRPVNQ